MRGNLSFAAIVTSALLIAVLALGYAREPSPAATSAEMPVALASAAGLQPDVATPETPRSAAAPSGGPQEGIGVHGHWTIEVQDPDGTTVSHQEFENALTPSGIISLNNILSRTETFGRWVVRLSTDDGQGPCRLADGVTGRPCFVAESDVPEATAEFHKNLVVSVPPAGQPNAGKLQLRGSATAAVDGQITVVGTHTKTCSSTVLPASCGNGPSLNLYNNFTTAPSPAAFAAQDVVAGQSILVTVVLSFA